MKKQKTQNTNKGITLIALVITIIVMLILVAVTISMAVNGGLFEYASNAGKQTNGATANEQLLASGQVNIDNVVYNSIDEYINSGENGVLTDKYGHRYKVEEPGQYYFYSYTYGQNFMTVFEVTEEDGKLKSKKLGEYSNETGKSRAEASEGDWLSAFGSSIVTRFPDAVCLGDSSDLVVTSVHMPDRYLRMIFKLVPGTYYWKETSGAYIGWKVVSGSYDYEYFEITNENELKNYINLHELAYSDYSIN